jgi:CheY-like chemotaxis protein
MPGLILLDLNLPRRSGKKVLQWIREQPQFANLPVVVYTSSDKPADKEQALQLGANEYIEKPSRIENIAAVMEKVKQRWLGSS